MSALLRRAIPLLLSALFAVTAAAQENIERKRYNCQVQTVSNQQGFVAVRAYTLVKAVAIASRNEHAVTRMDTHEEVKRVIQCVEWPDGKFDDAGFQLWVDQVLPK